MSEEKRGLVAAAGSGRQCGGGGGAAVGVVLGGGRWGRRSGGPPGLSPGRRVEESAVVGAPVQVGVGGDGGRVGGGAGGELSQLVSELLHLLSQTLHRVGAAGDGMTEGLRTQTQVKLHWNIWTVQTETLLI